MVNRKKNRVSPPWHQNLAAALLGNLKITLVGLILLTLALVALCVRGCGSSNSSSERAPTTSVKLPPAKPVITNLNVDQPPPPPQVREPSPTTSNPSPSTPAVKSAARAKAILRPKNVADWRQDDYKSAVRDGDPQLSVALRYFGTHFAGKESAAEFLAKLVEELDADPAAETAPSMRGFINPGRRSSRLAENVIAALDVNGTPRARQVIEGMLESVVDGTRKSSDRWDVAKAALRALAAHPGPGTEDLFLRIIAAQDQAATLDPVSGDAVKLRAAAVEAVRTNASESLLVRLVQWMIATEPPKPLQDQLFSALKEKRPENLAAQILLYESDRPNRSMREWLEREIVERNSGGLGRLLGIPAPEQQDAVLAKPVAPAGVHRLAERLWNHKSAAVLDRRLTAVATLEEGAMLVTIASTIPNAAVRAALLRTLERHWDETPKSLTLLNAVPAVNTSASQGASKTGFDVRSGSGAASLSLGAGGAYANRTANSGNGRMDVLAEPGFVTLLKALRRNDRPEFAAGKDASSRARGYHPSTAPYPKKLVEAQNDKKRQEKVGQQWMDFSRVIAQATCRRLCAAARAKQSDQGGDNSTADDANLPFKLHPNAKIVASYRLDWPDDLHGKIAAPPVLRVRYVRIEQKVAPASVFAFYRRQVPNAKEHALADGGWIDSIIIDKEQNRARSVDVLVARANKSVLTPPDQEQELNLDILAIECEGVVRPSAAPAGR